ncbi:MAG TPA: glycosyltransferase family 9 protein [Candidatus Omnitrophota bacterium]|nr:glycosyltransferase family 9 protein [Candidatus Omnitrophota bacterium]
MARAYVFKKPWKRILAQCFDVFGSVFFFWLPRKFVIQPARIRKLLIIRIDHLGDALLMRPALLKLRQSLPDAQIDLLTPVETAPLFLLDSFVDRVIPFDGHWYQSRSSFLKSVYAFFKLRSRIQKGNYDAAIDFRGDIRANLLMALAGVPARFGYGITGGGWLLTHEKHEAEDRHQVLRNLDLVSEFGVVYDPEQIENPRVVFPPSSEVRLKQFFSAAFSGSFAVIHPGAGNPEKEWPLSHFKLLAERLLAIEKVQNVIVVGSGNEKKRSGDFSGERVIDLRGQTDLHELACLISRAIFFIGNDSGPAHLAAAQGIPLVMIGSLTNKIEYWHPWTSRLVVVPSSFETPVSAEIVFDELTRLVN